MPSTYIHSPASPTDASGRFQDRRSPGNFDPLAMLAAGQAASLDAWLASPEFARHQAGLQAMIAEMALPADQPLAHPRSQGDFDQRGHTRSVTA